MSTTSFVGTDGKTYEMGADWLTNLQETVSLTLKADQTLTVGLCQEIEANEGFFGTWVGLHAQIRALQEFFDGTDEELDALEGLEQELYAVIESGYLLMGKYDEQAIKMELLRGTLQELGDLCGKIEGVHGCFQLERDEDVNPAKPWESFGYKVRVQTDDNLAYVETKTHEIVQMLFEIERLLSVLSHHEFVPNFSSRGEVWYGTWNKLTVGDVATMRHEYGKQVSAQIKSALYFDETVENYFTSRIADVAREYRQQAMAQDGLYCFWKDLAGNPNI